MEQNFFATLQHHLCVAANSHTWTHTFISTVSIFTATDSVCRITSPLLLGYTAQCLSFFKNSTQCILTEQMYAYCLEQGLSHS